MRASLYREPLLLGPGSFFPCGDLVLAEAKQLLILFSEPCSPLAFLPPRTYRHCIMLTAEKIIELLKLRPHPIEGGYFVETYRSEIKLPQSALPHAYTGDRLASTTIFYMLTPHVFSALHRLPGDEMFHFYMGDPVETFLLRDEGTSSNVTLGHDLASGMLLQHTVLGGVWQGSRLLPGGAFALLGTTMSPGFDYADYESGSRDALLARYPQHRDRILSLTR